MCSSSLHFFERTFIVLPRSGAPANEDTSVVYSSVKEVNSAIYSTVDKTKKAKKGKEK